MTRAARGLVLILCCLAAPAAFACSSPPTNSFEVEYGHAAEIFRAMLISSTIRTDPKFERRIWAEETARFRVTRVWKGTLKVGDIITTKSQVGAGPCGVSATNDPQWLEEVDSHGNSSYPRFSGDWLIYLHPGMPYMLSMTTRSSPTELKNAQEDIKQLDEIGHDKH
jgi:hypothetical protein